MPRKVAAHLVFQASAGVEVANGEILHPVVRVVNRRLGHLAGLLPDLAQLSSNDVLLGHKRYFSVESFTAQLRGAGYEVNRVEGIYLKPLTTAQMVSLELPTNIIDALCQLGVDYPELCCGILAEAGAVA